MERSSAYVTAAWTDDQDADTEQVTRCCRVVYKAGFSPVCPLPYLHLLLNNDVPEEHKSGVGIPRNMLRWVHALVIYGDGMMEDVKNDIAVAGRLSIAATTLDGILTVRGQGWEVRRDQRLYQRYW